MESNSLRNLLLTALIFLSSEALAKMITTNSTAPVISIESLEEYTILRQNQPLVTLFAAEPLEKFAYFVDSAKAHPEYTFCFVDIGNRSLEAILPDDPVQWASLYPSYFFSYKGIGKFGGNYIHDREGLERALDVLKRSIASDDNLIEKIMHIPAEEYYAFGREFYTHVLAAGESLFLSEETIWDKDGKTTVTHIPIVFNEDMNLGLRSFLESRSGIDKVVDVLTISQEGTPAYQKAFELYKAYLRGSKSALENYQSSGDARYDSLVKFNLSFIYFIDFALSADTYASVASYKK